MHFFPLLKQPAVDDCFHHLSLLLSAGSCASRDKR